MNQTQADRIIDVINKDANGVFRLFPEPGVACFAGGLLEDMDPTARDRYANCAWPINDVMKLEQHYGITETQLHSGMATNDTYADTDERRAALRRLVQSWVVDQATS